MGAYINKALVDGEEVIAKAHYHWLNWVVPSLAVVVPCVLQILSWSYVGIGVRAWLNYITIGLIVAGCIYFLWEYIRIKATEIAVTDRGIGIAKADQERVFERFFRVDKARSRATGGTGLGLAICKRLLERHGGGLRLVDGGPGATFEVHLPLEEE